MLDNNTMVFITIQLCLQPLEFMEQLTAQPDYIFKVLVVGNSYVGKSSYLMRLCNNTFSQRYSSTIGKSRSAQCNVRIKRHF